MNGGAVGRDGVLPRHLEADWETEVGLIQKKMRSGTYEFTSYREIVLSKGAHSLPRVVSVPTARDRIVLKALAKVLSELFPSARTPMAQIRVSQLADALSRKTLQAFIRVDVKNFYPTISHRAITEELHRKIRSRSIRHLVARAISTLTVSSSAPRPDQSSLVGVPQGLSISNILAEIAMTQIDARFHADPSIEYFRYVDDILILSRPDDVTRVLEDVGTQCRSIGLTIHPLGAGSKTQTGSLSETFDYLGYLFSPDGVSVRLSSINRLESTIIRLFTAYKYQLAKDPENKDWQAASLKSLQRRLDLVITGCVYDHIPRGWIHYFSQMNDLTLLSKLDAYVSKLKLRFGLDLRLETKSFTRAYWHVTKPGPKSFRYIPNFDKYDEAEKRSLLSALFPRQKFDTLPTADLERRFRAEVTRLVSMLERDVSETS